MDKYRLGNEAVSQSEPVGPPQTAVDEIYSRMGSHHNGLEFIREHISGVLGRAFGESPVGAQSPGKPRAVRSGSIGAIEDRQNDISELISEISGMLARLETIA